MVYETSRRFVPRLIKVDRTLAILMGVISSILLAVTGGGIAGLSSFWVGQRRRQIGVRRALGATRRDIVRYFLIENALISVAGVIVGILLAFEFNGWLMGQFELTWLSPVYVLVGVVMLLLLSQGAALAPHCALRGLHRWRLSAHRDARPDLPRRVIHKECRASYRARPQSVGTCRRNKGIERHFSNGD